MLNDLTRAATECGLKPVKAGQANFYGMIDGVFTTLVATGNGNFLLSLLIGKATFEADSIDNAPDGETKAKAARVKEILAAHDAGGDPRVFLTADRGMTAVVHLSANKKSAETLRAFLRDTLPALKNAGFGGGYPCAECGETIPENDVAYYADGAAVKLMHSDCCNKKLRENELKAVEENDNAHTLSGVLGALLGAIAGAALYLGVGVLGYVASIVGLATSWLTELLYRKFGGKNGWRKLVTLALALIFSVVLGQTACYCWQVASWYEDSGCAELNVGVVEFTKELTKGLLLGDTEGFLGWQYDVNYESLSEVERRFAVSRYDYVLENNTPELAAEAREAQSAYLKDLLMGLLYSALGGAFFIYRNYKSKHLTARRLAA